MKFGPVPTGRAEGAVLAHSVSAGGRRLRKGLVLTGEHLHLLEQAGIAEVVTARLEPGDVHENTAAGQLAAALVPDPGRAGLRLTDAFTGRVNILADGPGVIVLEVGALEAFNRVDPMITVATVPQYQQIGAGGMVATIKVISYAVAGTAVERAIAPLADLAGGAIRLSRPMFQSAGLVVTDIPGGPPNDKGVAAVRGRVEALGMTLTDLQFVPHRTTELSAALRALGGDLAMVLTGSATSDPDDVAPAALRAAGGHVDRFGMPVDPGNLLFVGALGDRPVIGLPGCARSPALNGADWVLSRIACGIAVSGADIAAMGVGGLLKEIPTRPQPRAGRRG